MQHPAAYEEIVKLLANNNKISIAKISSILAKYNEVFIGYQKRNPNEKYHEPIFNVKKLNKDDSPINIELNSEDYIISIANQDFNN